MFFSIYNNLRLAIPNPTVRVAYYPKSLQRLGQGRQLSHKVCTWAIFFKISKLPIPVHFSNRVFGCQMPDNCFCYLSETHNPVLWPNLKASWMKKKIIYIREYI